MSHCPGCKGNVLTVEYVDGLAVAGGSHTCPGVECAACAAKDAEIARLRALVAVGREIIEAIECVQKHNNPKVHLASNITEKWRSLEGGR